MTDALRELRPQLDVGCGLGSSFFAQGVTSTSISRRVILRVGIFLSLSLLYISLETSCSRGHCDRISRTSPVLSQSNLDDKGGGRAKI